MAGDWLKMRIDLQTHPKVVRILSATGTDKFRVIGGLHAVWAVFDAHSEDGVLRGYTPELMDHIIGWQGFSDAMIDAGWMQFDGDEMLVMPGFSEHNGKSGKRRAEDSKRKRDSRKSVPKVSAKRPQSVGQNADQRREEKSKEIKPPVSPLQGDTKHADEFNRAWSAYPKRSGANSKAEAWKAWKARIKAGADPQDMIAGVERYHRWCVITGKIGTEYVKQGVTFFGPAEHYLATWEAPVDETRQAPLSAVDRVREANRRAEEAERSGIRVVAGQRID